MTTLINDLIDLDVSPHSGGIPLREFRSVVARSAYDDLRGKLVSCGVRRNAHWYAFFAAVSAIAILPETKRGDAIKRMSRFGPFIDFPVNWPDDVDVYADVVRRRLSNDGWDESAVVEALAGVSYALAEVASQLTRVPTIYHMDINPTLRTEGFSPFIDELVFGISRLRSSAAVVAANNLPSIDPALIPAIVSSKAVPKSDATEVSPMGSLTLDPATENPSIRSLVDAWLTSRNFGTSETARRDSAAGLFLIAVGLKPEGACSALANIQSTAAEGFIELSMAVGPKWGTVRRKLEGRSARDITALATTQPLPAWASHDLSTSGAAARVVHAMEFLEFVRESGVDIPRLDWDYACRKWGIEI